MSPRAVATFWAGPPLGPYERLCLTSFRQAGYDVTVYSYGAEGEIPDGVAWGDATQIVPREEFEAALASGAAAAPFADVFRYRLLAASGATWIDADVLLVGECLPEGEYLFGREDAAAPHVANGILRAPADSTLVHNLVRRAGGMDLSSVAWGTSGPLLLTDELRALGMLGRARDPHDLYPIMSHELPLLFDPAAAAVARDRVRGSFTVHLWNEVMRRGGAPVKQVRPPAGSWIADQFLSRGVDFGTPYEHDVRWITEAVNPSLQRDELEAAIVHYRRECDALDTALAAKHHEWVAAVHRGDFLELDLRDRERTVGDLEQQLADCGQRLRDADAHIRSIEASRSWRLLRRIRGARWG